MALGSRLRTLPALCKLPALATARNPLSDLTSSSWRTEGGLLGSSGGERDGDSRRSRQPQHLLTPSGMMCELK